MVILITNKKNTEKKMQKNCLHEDDVGKKCLRGRICLKKCLQKKISRTPLQKSNCPSLIATRPRSLVKCYGFKRHYGLVQDFVIWYFWFHFIFKKGRFHLAAKPPFWRNLKVNNQREVIELEQFVVSQQTRLCDHCGIPLSYF